MLLWAVSFLCLPTLTSGALSYPPSGIDGLGYPTGLVPHTSEEEAWIRDNWPVVRRVLPNPIGLQRLNARRAQRGLRPLAESGVKPALTGADTVAVIDGGPVPLADDEGGGVLAALPPHVNNSVLPSFPPIRSQGQLGSCVSFATTYYQMTHTVAMMRGWNAKNGGDAYRFSPKWTYNFVNGGTTGGTTYINNYNVLLKHGAATWAQFPYSGSTNPVANYREWLLDTEVWRSAIQYRTHGVQQVYNVSAAGFDQVRQLLNNGYVLVFSTYINSWQYTKVGDDPATPPDLYAGQWVSHYVGATAAGGHAMTLVGYDDELWVDINGNGAVDPGERGAFLIANSWGANWRNAGYVWLAYDALHAESQVDGGPQDRRAAITSDRVYHLTVPESYQPKLLAEFTVHHARRNQLRMSLGSGAPSDTVPQGVWMSGAINHQGGAFAFDGTSTPVEGTFVFDLTDLANECLRTQGEPIDGSGEDLRRWFLTMRDNATGDIATLKAFKLIETFGSEAVEYAGEAVLADNETVHVWVDYDCTPYTDMPPPVAENVSIAGEPRVGNTLTGSYDYVGGNSEGDSALRWLRADSADGEYAPIEGATGNTCTPAPEDIGKFIVFEVTPVDVGGLAGEPVTSEPIGPVYMLGDFSGDGVLSGLDIPGFKQALADPDGWTAANPQRPHPNALGDFNDDGVFSGLDIVGFKQSLDGQ